MSFVLHPQLARDCVHVGDLALCRVLLMNNKNFPWLVLIPMRGNLCELFDLAPADYSLVMEEVRRTAKEFAALTQAHKINIAALGNVVPQLHIHVIARFTEDAAWPNPIWNSGVAGQPYEPEALGYFMRQLRDMLG